VDKLTAGKITQANLASAEYVLYFILFQFSTWKYYQYQLWYFALPTCIRV